MWNADWPSARLTAVLATISFLLSCLLNLKFKSANIMQRLKCWPCGIERSCSLRSRKQPKLSERQTEMKVQTSDIKNAKRAPRSVGE